MQIIRDKSFYKSVFAIAVPLALQNLITLTTNLADSLMLGRADTTGVNLSAATQANQPFFFLTMCCFGMAGAAMVLNAQYFGKGDFRAIRRVFSIVIKCSFLVSVFFGALVLLFPEAVMRVFAANPDVVAAGAEYLRIFGYGYLFYGLSVTLIFSLRSVAMVKIAVFVNLLSLVTNVFLNWVLIFGNLGAPALGIRGAAIATLAARILECVVIYVYVFCVDKKLAFRPRHLLIWDKGLFGDLFRYGAPVFCNEITYGLGITLQAVILGHITYAAGDPVAAQSISSMVQQIATLFLFGIANAAAVLVGKAIGEGDVPLARARAHTFRYIGYAIGILAAGAILLLRRVVVDFYTIPEETKALAMEFLAVIALITFFVGTGAISIVGSLRGAGDTKFCFLTELTTLWGVALPAAFLCAYVFQAPVPLVLFCMRIDDPLKAVACVFRMRTNKWIRSVTREIAADSRD